MTERYTELLKKYIYENCVGMTREAAGKLKYPYIVPCSPGSPYYSGTLWDWDSWLTSVMLGQVEADRGGKGAFTEYERGSVLNFLDACQDDGCMPICLTEKGALRLPDGASRALDTNMHKPVLAQQAAALVRRDNGDVGWIAPYFDRLEAFLNCYLQNYRNADTSLLYWRDDFAVGVDNDPSVFYRPKGSCGSIYLNCLMVREMWAFGYLLEQSGDIRRANAWRGRAQDLTDAINEYCWDERDGTYYSVDFALLPVDAGSWLHKGAPRDYPCMLSRVDSWSSFMPLWAGVADARRAARVLERVRDERTYACRAGIRTLSRLEKMYDLRASNNPSNWRGPVWGVSNYMVFSGLNRYGFTDDARDIAMKTIDLFGRDLEENGSLHEYYNPDTCLPIVTHNFQNWNFLVLNMIAWLEGRKFMDTF